MTIDATTGLAQLPDDMFWRVVEHDRYNKYSYYDHVEFVGVKLQLIRKYTETTEAKTETRKEKVQRVGFWDRLILGPIEERTVTVHTLAKTEEKQKEILSRSSIDTYWTKEDREEHTPKEGYVFASYLSNWGQTEYCYVKANPVNAETLARLSKEIFTEWITAAHTSALKEDTERYRDNFLGDYPPKSLVAV